MDRERGSRHCSLHPRPAFSVSDDPDDKMALVQGFPFFDELILLGFAMPPLVLFVLFPLVPKAVLIHDDVS